MINQLLGSSRAQRQSFKTSQIRHNTIDVPKNFRTIGQKTHIQNAPPDFPSERSMPRRLTPVKFNIVPADADEDKTSMWDIENSVRDKLKQKQIFLPNISFSPLNHQSNKHHKYSVKRHSLNPTEKHHKSKTEASPEHLQALQDEYDRTIVQIKQINSALDRQYRKQIHKRKKFYTENYSEMMAESALKRKEAFRKGSRRAEFEEYVQYLEGKQKLLKMGAKYQQRVRENEIGKMLESRVQTRKRNRSRASNNPELRTLQLDSSQQFHRGHQRRLNEQYAHESQPQTKVRDIKENHNDFIRLLRMAKNRGQTLLSKLQNYNKRQPTQ